jgi:putative endonuclease
MDHEYWTYIVASLSGTLYIGMTNNIEWRMWEHKSKTFEGFVRDYHCNRLVYYEGFDQVLDAIARKKQLKGWRRSRKIALIESRNPRWADLAEKWGWRFRKSRSRAAEWWQGDGWLWRKCLHRAAGAPHRHGVLRLRLAVASLRSG